jgi:hypothetical protein
MDNGSQSYTPPGCRRGGARRRHGMKYSTPTKVPSGFHAKCLGAPCYAEHEYVIYFDRGPRVLE